MNIRRLLVAGALGAGLVAMLARNREGRVSMHEQDWLPEGEAARRRYRSPAHLLHHFGELAGMLLPVAEVYLLRALSPAFREQVMITTAMANDCSP